MDSSQIPSAGPRHLTAGFQKPIQVVLIKMIQGQIQTLQEIAWQVVNFVKGLDLNKVRTSKFWIDVEQCWTRRWWRMAMPSCFTGISIMDSLLKSTKLLKPPKQDHIPAQIKVASHWRYHFWQPPKKKVKNGKRKYHTHIYIYTYHFI